MKDIVLLPGWSFPADTLAALADALPGWRVHAMDLPGGTCLSGMAEALLAMAPAEAVWFGWSLGGMVAAQAAASAPTRVQALCTYGSNLSFVARDGWPNAMPATSLDEFIDLLQTEPARALARFRQLAAQGTDRETMRLMRHAPAVAVSPHTLRDGLQLLHEADLRQTGMQIACPQAWFFGGRDVLVPPAAGADLKRTLPGARVRVLADAGHALPLCDAARLADELELFLQESR